jgi:hypothetical protein
MSFSPNKVDRSSGITTLTMRHSNSEAGQQFMTMKSQTTRLHQIQSGTGSQLPKIKQARAGMAK